MFGDTSIQYTHNRVTHTQVECMVILLLIVCNGTGLAVEYWNFEMVNGDDCNTRGLRS